MGVILAGLGFIVAMFLWCRLVPDQRTRVEQMIALWIVIALVNAAVFLLDRHFHFLAFY